MIFRRTSQRYKSGTTRRWLAVFSAAMFLFTGVVHAAACTEASAKTAISDTAFSPTEDDADMSKQSALDCDNHCHGCAAVSVPVASAQAFPVAKASRVLPAVDYRFDADQRPSDPPPPRS
jgi:hypothetical protein